MPTSTVMSAAELEYWQRILESKIPNAATEKAFKERLCQEQKDSQQKNWTPEFCDRAILEFKKALFLAWTSKRMIAPSRAVDAVCDLFVLHTRDWRLFCQEVLGCHCDHFPYHGQPTALQRIDRFLMASITRGLYQKYFGEMPKEFWQD